MQRDNLRHKFYCGVYDGMYCTCGAEEAGEETVVNDELATAINQLANEIHLLNRKWWVDIETGKPLNRNRGELLMLIVSEIAEAMEADRKGLADDKLPDRDGLTVELADAVIRIFDMCGGLSLDLGGALIEKLEYNAKRADHTHEHRKAAGGKKY